MVAGKGYVPEEAIASPLYGLVPTRLSMGIWMDPQGKILLGFVLEWTTIQAHFKKSVERLNQIMFILE